MRNIEQRFISIQKDLQGRASLIAVSKTRTVSEIEHVYNLGQIHFGENKVQELSEKSESFKKIENLKWHFIGYLQSNKINQLLKVPNLVAIHSIDRLSLLEKLIKKSPLQNIDLYLQINTSGENEKSGFTDFSQIMKAVELIKTTEHYKFAGLMTIGKIRTQNFEEDAKSCFYSLLELKKKVDPTNNQELKLSMGMSQDYKIALDFESNWVRIGTELFGKRV